MLEHVAAGDEARRAGLPDRHAVVPHGSSVTWQCLLDRLGHESGEVLGDIRTVSCASSSSPTAKWSLPGSGSPYAPCRVSCRHGSRAGAGSRSGNVRRTWVETATGSRAGERRGVAAGAHHHAVEARRPAAGADRPVGVTATTSSGTIRSPSAATSAAIAARVRITPPSSSITPSHAPSSGGAADDRAAAHAGRAHERARAVRPRARQDRPVARHELDPEPLLPLAPRRARLDRERDQARVVVRVAEDPRLAAGLRGARRAALVHGHVGAALAQRERGREADDPGADNGDLHGSRRASAAVSASAVTPSSSWRWPTRSAASGARRKWAWSARSPGSSSSPSSSTTCWSHAR